MVFENLALKIGILSRYVWQRWLWCQVSDIHVQRGGVVCVRQHTSACSSGLPGLSRKLAWRRVLQFCHGGDWFCSARWTSASCKLWACMFVMLVRWQHWWWWLQRQDGEQCGKHLWYYNEKCLRSGGKNKWYLSCDKLYQSLSLDLVYKMLSWWIVNKCSSILIKSCYVVPVVLIALLSNRLLFLL